MVKDWKCVQKAVVSDICAGNKTHSINIEQRHNQPSGVVRSHERFPWEYGKDVFHIENNRYAPRCTVTFNGYLQTRRDFSRVAIYVASLDIGDDFNTAFIQDVELEQSMTYIHNFTTGPVNITFGFKFTDNSIKGGSGFVLYYKFLKVGETYSSLSDLEDVIKTKQGMHATCVHNHQYFCPFRKMCDRKKSKLFVPSNNSHNFCTYRSIKKPGKPKHCLKEEKHDACKVRKTAFKGRVWRMIINGNFTEKYFTCKWMFKCKRRKTWNITFVSDSIDRRFDNFTVKHFRCENPDLMTYTTLVPQTTPYTMDEGDVITVEYSRITDRRFDMEPDIWKPPNTDTEMIFERSRKRKG
ncbi:uncharacterized protein LOC110441744 isoform X2 [Mizuhopecten yessoensis]|nr:uncharacterized protein LOC110441744 isoform X2 [Mizuhopecten yessoensis]